MVKVGINKHNLVLVSDVEPLVYYIVLLVTSLLHFQFLDEELRIEVFQERVRVVFKMIQVFYSIFVV